MTRTSRSITVAIAVVVIAIGARANALSAAAAPNIGVAPNLAYEPFCSPVGAPPTTTPPDYGWAAGSWGGGNVLAPGLTWTGLLKPVPSCNAWGPSFSGTHSLATPVMPVPGSTLVLRALVRSDRDGTPASQATLFSNSAVTGGALVVGDLPQNDPQAGNWGIQTDFREPLLLDRPGPGESDRSAGGTG